MTIDQVHEVDDLVRRHDDLLRRYAAELRLSDTLSAGGGIADLIRTTAELAGSMVWLLDEQSRVVAHAAGVHPAEIRTPDLGRLLRAAEHLELDRPGAVMVPADPALGLTRRHIVRKVEQGDTVFAWLVLAEVPARFSAFHGSLADAAARHLAIDYAMQSRVAKVAWNVRSALARQLIRGSVLGEDLDVSADYLGVDATADRVLVYLTGLVRVDDLEAWSGELSEMLGVEILAARGSEGVTLLIEAPREVAPVVMVGQVKRTIMRALAERGESTAIAGVSAVARHGVLERAYREAREVAVCAAQIGRGGPKVITVDDLGPARLFIANSNLEAVSRYVQDILGTLLSEKPSHADLIRTLQCFFDSGRRVRESAATLCVHENTVRLRLAKVHDLTGLDVAADANDQLSAQTALLVLRLQGHPALVTAADDLVLEAAFSEGE